MNKKLISPIKWVGGKARLLHELQMHLPEKIESYYEPFFGGGALFFASHFTSANLNDSNPELVNFYEVLKSSCEALIEMVLSWPINEDFYYEIRSWDRSPTYIERSSLERASRFLYLNRTCFNGLWRMNVKHGYNNTPWGKPKKVDFQIEKLRDAAKKIKNMNLTCVDFETAVETAKEGDFVYFDPPYVPISKTSSFTGYTIDGFSDSDQIRLKKCCDSLNERKVNWMLSNSTAPRVYELYAEYKIEEVQIQRLVGGKGSERKSISEVLIRNYD